MKPAHSIYLFAFFFIGKGKTYSANHKSIQILFLFLQSTVPQSPSCSSPTTGLLEVRSQSLMSTPATWASCMTERVNLGRVIDEIIYIQHIILLFLLRRCGGTLISESHVLTTARCTKQETVSTIKVLVGGHNIGNENI